MTSCTDFTCGNARAGSAWDAGQCRKCWAALNVDDVARSLNRAFPARPVATVTAGPVTITAPLPAKPCTGCGKGPPPAASVLPPSAPVALPLLTRPACRFEGGILEACPKCGPDGHRHVRECDVHGKCVREPVGRTDVKFCLGCREYQPDDAVSVVIPALPDPLPLQWGRPGPWVDSREAADAHDRAARLLAGRLLTPPPMEGEGIVTCGGGKYWPGVVVMVRMLRESGSTLPVEVWYRGSCEAVNPADVAGLGVTLIDADAMAAKLGDNRVPRGKPNPGGWSSKLYALTHTRFRHILFIDADAYFVADPGPLLELGKRHGFAAWAEPGTDNVKWAKCGFPRGKPADAPPSVQGGQFALDRERCWRELVLAHWICQHEDYYWPAGKPHVLFGDQDAWRLAFTLTGFRPHVVGSVEYRAGWGYVCWMNGVTAVEHRCFSKLVPEKTAGEARALAHYVEHLGADRPAGWLTPDEARLLRDTCRGKRVVEWGRFHGRSTLVIAAVAERLWSVDRLTAAPAAAALAREGLTADLVVGDYTDPATRPPFAPGVVFVDGEHHREAVIRDLDLAVSLLPPGGVIALHDHGDPNAPDVAPAAEEWAASHDWELKLEKAGTLAVIVWPGVGA